MDLPKNRFKAALKEGRHQIGIWNALGGRFSAEMLAACRFDFIVVDTEHSPIEPAEVMGALQAIAGFPATSAVVRPVVNDTALIKRYLDIGAQTLIVPYVQNREEAEAAVRAMRYPPEGVRGVAGMTRASLYGNVKDYATRAQEELCLIVQVETVEAMEQLEDIATVDGVDGVFIGPADLSTSMGFAGQTTHPEVKTAIADAFARLQTVGVPSGILTLDEARTRETLDQGTGFTAVTVDVSLLVRAATALRESFADVSPVGG